MASKNNEWLSLTEAAERTGYNKSRLSILAKEGRIKSSKRRVKMEVVQMQTVLQVRLSDVLKHRATARPGPKPD